MGRHRRRRVRHLAPDRGRSRLDPARTEDAGEIIGGLRRARQRVQTPPGQAGFTARPGLRLWGERAFPAPF
ncbi:MAG: hypothetical protein ACK55I_37415, partial [bacterium]